jgi:signal transduction histidine kinase
MEGVDPSTMQDGAPAVRIDALDMFVELLSQVEDDHSSDAFYGRLCEATCALTSMDRAVIFRYDEVRRRVRAAGAYGIDLEAFADAHVTVETAPVARQSLEEDRVIEVSGDFADEIPEEFRDLLRESNLVCTPLAAAGRWFGVILSDSSKPGPLSDEERYLLWTLGKTAALATLARVATTAGARARQLQERIDLARDVHESVIQRLFGVQLVFSSSAELKPEARERIAAELQAALVDLRRALQRPLGRVAPETQTTLLEEVERLSREHPDLHLELRRGSERVSVPKTLEPLAQSVLAEAVRNAIKHAQPTRVEIAARQAEGAWMLEITNDGVAHRPRPRPTGMGLRLAAIEALQAGGLVDYGEREPGVWRVRLAVPHDRP